MLWFPKISRNRFSRRDNWNASWKAPKLQQFVKLKIDEIDRSNARRSFDDVFLYFAGLTETVPVPSPSGSSHRSKGINLLMLHALRRLSTS